MCVRALMHVRTHVHTHIFQIPKFVTDLFFYKIRLIQRYPRHKGNLIPCIPTCSRVVEDRARAP